MHDQAEKLRELVQDIKKEEEPRLLLGLHSERIVPSKTCRIIGITSGKGGVGKTNIAVNLAISLAQLKREILLLDADMGLANIDVILGMNPKFNLEHVIIKGKNISDVMITGPENIKIIPGATGIQELADLDEKRREEFLKKISPLENLFDIVIIDTGAGISQNILSFVLASNEIIVVTTPEPTSVMDAYSIIKIILQKNSDADIKLIVNMAETEEVAKKTQDKIVTVCRQFLNASIEPLGWILYDKMVARSVTQQKPFIVNYPNTTASKNIHAISKKLLNLSPAKNEVKGISSFFRKIGLFGR